MVTINALLNEFGYVVGFSSDGFSSPSYTDYEIDGCMPETVGDKIWLQLNNGKLKLNKPTTDKPEGVNIIYDGKEWVEKANYSSQIDFWKEKMISASKEKMILTDIGMDGSIDYINASISLEKYKNNFMIATHSLAIEMNNIFDSKNKVV